MLKKFLLVDARYSLQQNLPPLTQAPPRATVIVHGDWFKELNDYSYQIKRIIQLLSSCRRTQVSNPGRHVGA